MLAYDVRGDIREIERHISGLGQRQIPFASVLAMTRTAKFAEQKVRDEIPRVFDRPTPFAKRSTFVQPATKARQYAMVLIREQEKGRVAPIRYLAPQVYGGARGHKSFEKRLIEAGKMPPTMYAVAAAAAQLDQYGNIKGGQITKMLSDLQAHYDETQNTTARSAGRRLRSRTRRASFYFSTWPPSQKTQHLKPGIYLRSHFGFGTAIKPVLIFVRRARYKRRLRFFEIADQASRYRFPIEFALALRHAMATAR